MRTCDNDSSHLLIQGIGKTPVARKARATRRLHDEDSVMKDEETATTTTTEEEETEKEKPQKGGHSCKGKRVWFFLTVLACL